MYSFASWLITIFCLATAVLQCSARHISHGRFHVNHNYLESTAVADLASARKARFNAPDNPLRENLSRRSAVHHKPGLLLPAVSEQFDRHDLQNLVPQKDLQVYYEECGKGTSAAFVSFTDLKHPTVILEHSFFITQVQCTGQKLVVSFIHPRAATFALKAWTATKSTKIFVTNSESCSFGFPAERGWLLVSSIEPQGSLAIVCNFSEVPAKHVTKTVQVDFGRTNRTASQKNPVVCNAPKPATNSSDNSLSPTTSGSPAGILSNVSSTTATSDVDLSTASSVFVFTSSSTSLTSYLASTSSLSYTSSTSGSALPTSTVPPNTIQDFDTSLDDSIGYLDPSSPDFWSQLLPSVSSSQTSSFGTAAKRLRRRDFDLVAIASSLTQSISSAVSSATNTVNSVIQSASDAFASTVATVVSAAVDLLNALSPFTLGPFPFSATPQNTDQSDFGPGIILTQSSGSSGGVTGQLTTYCVGCGATGSFTLAGTVIFDAEEGISSAIFDITGNIHAQLELAAVASVSFSESVEKNIFTQGLPALTLTGLVVIGPAISLDVGATADFSITGGLAAGYQLDWPAITAHFDLTNDIYTANGLIPTGSPIFDYEGDVKASATIYGLISLTFGIDILSGKYKANVGLVDKPEIDTSAEAVIYSDYQISQMDDGTVYCDGDSLSLSFLDSAYADVVFLNATKTYPLTSWLGPSLSTCIGTLSTVSHSATSTDPADPDPTDPAGDDGSTDDSDSTSTTDSSTPTASPAATVSTSEPAPTSSDGSGSSSPPSQLTTSAPLPSFTQDSETSSSDLETSTSTSTEDSTTATSSDDSTTTTSSDDSTTTTSSSDSTTTTTSSDDSATTTSSGDSTTTTTSSDDSATTTSSSDSTTTSSDDSATTTSSSYSTTTTTSSDDGTTTTSSTDSTTTTTSSDDSSTTTSSSDGTTTTTTTSSDDSATTTSSDGTTTTTTSSDDSATTTSSDDSATTTSSDDNTATVSSDDSTITTSSDDSTTTPSSDDSTATISSDDSATSPSPDSETTALTEGSTTTTSTYTSTTSLSTSATSTPTPVCDPAPLAAGICCYIPNPAVYDNAAYYTWQGCVFSAALTVVASGRKNCTAQYTDGSLAWADCLLALRDTVPAAAAEQLCIPLVKYSYDWLLCLSYQYYVDTMWDAYNADGNDAINELEGYKRDVATTLSDTSIHDSINGTSFLSWAADGNIVVTNTSSSFSSLNGNIIGDTQSRLLHLYNDTIENQGISRLRLASLDLMPLTSVLVTLAPISVPSEPSPILVAFTSAGSYYYLITCIMEEQAPKIFLAADVAAGISALESPALQDTMTGGTVTECGLMAWTTG